MQSSKYRSVWRRVSGGIVPTPPASHLVVAHLQLNVTLDGERARIFEAGKAPGNSCRASILAADFSWQLILQECSRLDPYALRLEAVPLRQVRGRTRVQHLSVRKFEVDKAIAQPGSVPSP